MRCLPFKKFLVLSCLLLTACGQDSNSIDEITRLFEEDKSFFEPHANNTLAVVIIPRVGCSSCIGLADHFFQEVVDTSPKVKFVFTKIQSEKTLKIRLGKARVMNQNVLLDKTGRYAQKELDSWYPLLITMEEGKVKEVTTITPKQKELISELKRELALTFNPNTNTNKF